MTKDSEDFPMDGVDNDANEDMEEETEEVDVDVDDDFLNVLHAFGGVEAGKIADSLEDFYATRSNSKKAGSSDDLSLPKATVTKIISEILTSFAASPMSPDSHELPTSKDFRDAMAECCVEFITMLSSEANEISENEAKKTMSAEHIAESLKQLGFEEYIDAVMESADEFKKAQANREKKQSKIEQSGLSDEQLLEQQEALFRSAAAKHRQREANDHVEGEGGN